jgi:hypothetical protein
MDLDAFKKWSIELSSAASAVNESVQLNIPEVSAVLDKTHIGDAPDHAAICELQFRNITAKIQGVMAAHDKVLMSLGYNPVFYSRRQLT